MDFAGFQDTQKRVEDIKTKIEKYMVATRRYITWIIPVMFISLVAKWFSGFCLGRKKPLSTKTKDNDFFYYFLKISAVPKANILRKNRKKVL